MKVSVNWLKQFTDIDLLLDELVGKIGAQLGAVEEVVDIGARYQGVVVVRVVVCEPHPNGNKLTVCLVDDAGIVKKVPRNTNGFVQIVCGAPNVESGMLAAWLPPGSTVPATSGSEPMTLEARDIRGVTSHGMLASPKELAFGDDHNGLLIVDEDIAPGTDFAKAYRLDDHIIDIENKMFTHRPDLFGILGIAREIAGISGKKFSSPDWYLKPSLPPAGRDKLELQLKNEVPKLVPRLTALAISGVRVGPSPIWLQSYLMRAGIRPVNNVVDLTNFVMYETGQPLHAYDLDKIASSSESRLTLSARKAKSGEELTLLDGRSVSLGKNTIVIAANDKAIGIGGVMGGQESAVDEGTRNIVLEGANFDMNSVRRVARQYGLFTDAVTRFTKNPSPWPIPAVIAKAATDILRLAGGSVASPLLDEHAGLSKSPSITVSSEFIYERLGLELSTSQISKLLDGVEIPTQTSGSKLTLTVPVWRTDLAIAEDIVEEVGRLHGYDHLPLQLPSRDLHPAETSSPIAFKETLRSRLSEAGGNEVLTYSFVHGSLIDKAGQSKAKAFHIRNALSPDLQYYRLSLAPSLLEKIHSNIKAGVDKMALYEIGSVHVKGVDDDEGLPAEIERFAAVIAHKSPPEDQGAPYFAARRYADHLLHSLGLPVVSYKPAKGAASLPPKWQPALAAYEPTRTAIASVGKQVVGIVGEPQDGLARDLKLPAYTGMVELDIATLAELAGNQGGYQPLNRLPALSYDLCLRTAYDLPHEEAENFLGSALDSASSRHGYGFSLRPLDIYQSETDSKHKQTTWRIELWHPAKTLTTKEINELVDTLVAAAKTKLKAVRI